MHRIMLFALLALTSCKSTDREPGEASSSPAVLKAHAEMKPPPASKNEGNIEVRIDRIQQGYGVRVTWADGPFVVHTRPRAILGNLVSPRHLEAAIPVVVAAIQKYPPPFLQAIPLSRVVLCSDLSSAGSLRTAALDHETKTVYVNICKLGAEDVDEQRLEMVPGSMHHEIFHLLDGKRFNDAAWEAANPTGFTYGPEGLPPPDPPPAGFVTPYATSALWEDKAEVFAALMDDATGLLKRSESDSVLDRKVRLLRSILEQRFAGVPMPIEIIRIPLDAGG